MAKSDHGKPAREGWSREYERAWLKVHGKKCPDCESAGHEPFLNKQGDFGGYEVCSNCNGIGYVEKKK